MQETLTRSLRDAEPLALQAFQESPALEAGEASYFALACVALSGHAVGDAIWEFLSPVDGYVRLECPECEAEYEVTASAIRCGRHARHRPCRCWRRGTVPNARAPADLPPGFEGFSAAARAVAEAGLPGQASEAAVWCLVAAKGGLPWARTLLRLTGHFHSWCRPSDS